MLIIAAVFLAIAVAFPTYEYVSQYYRQHPASVALPAGYVPKALGDATSAPAPAPEAAAPAPEPATPTAPAVEPTTVPAPAPAPAEPAPKATD